MERLKILLLSLTMLTIGVAGCIGTDDDTLDEQSLDELTGEDFSTARGWSMPTDPAEFEILDGVSLEIESFDGTAISLGIFRPAIEGCDWSDQEQPEACQLPVVMDAGPYWGTGEEEVSYRPPIIEWLVPRGYTVVHMSVRGTGESGGCMEFMSLNEQRDVDHTVTWLAEQAWSNGNVGMMGRSYDGTTPFMAAAHGNPHLKTIVPISGVSSVPDLMFKNGTSETRGPIMHTVVYWALFGIGPEPPETVDSQLCQETAEAQVEGLEAFATGDTSSDYWRVREFRDRILESYNGSMFVVHGMEDWNVNPSQVVPWIREAKEAGIPTRAWLGQWAHAYPDRIDEHRNVRWDWAQETLEWFDYYLKDEGDQPPLTVEVEDSLYVWHEYDTYPPADIAWQELELAADLTLAPEGKGSEGTFVLTGPPTGQAISGDVGGQGGPHAIFTSEVLDEDVQITGVPQLHVTASSHSAEPGWIFAKLYDVFPDGQSVRIGWAAMNLAYYEGGNQDRATWLPGQDAVAKMIFEPMEAHVAEGHRLRLQIDKGGVADIPASPSTDPIELSLGGEQSLLRLSTVEDPAVLEVHETPKAR